MAIIEVRKTYKKNRSKAKTIYGLLSRGKITRHIVNGALAYDNDEYKAYCATKRKGRPAKALSNDTVNGIAED